jgi:hypothetical protein
MPFSGTPTGPALDLPAHRPAGGGRSADIVIFRLADGKSIKAWQEYDGHGMRRQFAAPPQARANR